MPLSLSTSWNASGVDYANRLIFEIKNLGFKEVELSFNLSAEMIEDIIRLVKHGQIIVSSLHNYCPVPEGLKRQAALPDYYSLASNDPLQRALALKYTKKTIETAKRLNARAVVVHAGRVEMPDQTRPLITLYENGLGDSREFRKIRDNFIKARQLKAKGFLDNALKSLDKLNLYAKKNNILLGLENRFYYREIPAFEEIGEVLKAFSGGNIFYWHDTGHAQLMENLKFIKHISFLKAYAKKLLGIHLHNIAGCQDHLPPVKGELDFNFIKPYLKEGIIKVIEAHASASRQDLIKSKELLEKIFNE